LEGATDHITLPSGVGVNHTGALNRSTVSNVRSHVPTEKANGVHDTQSTNKISAHEQKLTQSSQKHTKSPQRTVIDERISAGRTNESRERTHLLVEGNMSISADSQVPESNEEYNDISPGVIPNASNDLNNPPSNRTSAVIIRDDRVGYS